MNQAVCMLSAIAVSVALFGAFLALPVSDTKSEFLFNTADAVPGGATHTIQMRAETLPNGQDAYKLVSHVVDGNAVSGYGTIATIPGPTIIVNAGDTVQVTLTNDIAGKSVGFQVPGLSNSNAKAATGTSKTFTFTANSAGTYLYQNKDDALLGLYGAIIVNPVTGSIGKYVEEETGILSSATTDDLDKEFVLFMVGSTFWGQEISDGNQTPLWTNPTIGADEGEIVRFHVLALGHPHTFHLHAHRWVESTTNDNIIDTKLLLDGGRHVFIVKSGADVGPGHWQYHCHVFAHMEAGMHGIFAVGGVIPAMGDMPAMNVDGESIPGANPHNGLLSGGDGPGLVTFKITDEPGRWFESARGDALAGLTITKSLEVARSGDYVNFVMSDTDTVHTITSLLWPTSAAHMPLDQVQSYKGGGIVELTTPGLYVFTCKVHPYMFGAVIVDDPNTQIDPTPIGEGVLSLLGSEVSEDGGLMLDLGQTITLVNGATIPTGSDLALRLAKTFFIATTPENWRDYNEPSWNPTYPDVSVKAHVAGLGDVAVISLDALLEAYFTEGATNTLATPDTAGVGEVWINTQFEKTAGKTKPGAATAVDVATWEVTKKVALPGYNMNNPHNMWTDKNQTVIYQTEWFSNKLTTFDRATGAPISQIKVGEAPSHVMTRADNDDIHVALNGEEGVAEIFATTNPIEVNRIIAMQGYGDNPTHPHAHWMSHDGQKMVTPNAFTHDSTLYSFADGQIIDRQPTGILAIATGMTPDSEYYVVANLLSSTISVMDMDTGAKIRDLQPLADYNPIPLHGITGSIISDDGDGNIIIAALPIQTPISPDGKYMVTANTLTGNILITDVSSSDPNDWFFVKTLDCDPGCHGVQFGAKQGGGYYAYVSSKFANDLIVVDIDDASDTNLEIIGRILLTTNDGMTTDTPSAVAVTGNAGQGGQGVLAIPNVYNGWVQNLPEIWLEQLTISQRDPI
jgi:FtsP/CotA-like multicopper oxidase with cupredoxin domain